MLTTLCEMAFAAHCGLELMVDVADRELNAFLFCEEPGVVVQVNQSDLEEFMALAANVGLTEVIHEVGQPASGERLRLFCQDRRSG